MHQWEDIFETNEFKELSLSKRVVLRIKIAFFGLISYL
jgi:hypothetical protein